MKKGLALISTSPNDTIKNEWSSSNFDVYANKIVRKVDINFIGLDRSVYDTTKRVNMTVSRIANSLHTQTKERVIRNHLFVYKNKPLNPFLLASQFLSVNNRQVFGFVGDSILGTRQVFAKIETTPLHAFFFGRISLCAFHWHRRCANELFGL